MKAYTITTPIYYINDLPHLGTAYTTVLTDVLARYHRSRGEEVFFLTGTDENGEKIMRAAQDRSLTPRQLVDTMSECYRASWQDLNISYDRFIRTTDEDHVQAVQQIFRTLQEKGDIYKGRYEGWYCVHDETFLMEAPDGLCPECGRPVEKVQRDSYFFALSRYGDRLLKLYEEHPEFVQPDFRRNEVVRFIQDGLRDMSITRENNGWGIPVPGDPDHVVYVWFDALVNYVAAAGYPEDPARLEQFWPAALHIVGKDILVRFHATLWPAMLMGAGLALPRQILAHGWLMINERKMSKSLIEQQLAQWRQDESAGLKVTSLRPLDLVRSLQEVAGIPPEKTAIAVDALRYFLVRELPPGSDAEFSLDRLVERYNADLANDLGNLLNRTLPMLQRYCEGKVPPVSHGVMEETAAVVVEAAAAAYEALQPGEALAETWKLIRAGNHFIDEQKPWVLQREGRHQELGAVLYACGEAYRIAAVLLAPVMPAVAAEILRQLGLPADPSSLMWEASRWGGWQPGAQPLAPEPIFPRIDVRKDKDQSGKEPSGKGKPSPGLQPTQGGPSQSSPVQGGSSQGGAAGGAAASKETEAGTPPGEISIDEFARVKLRIATIREVVKIEGARKLLRLSLDLGEEQRQIVSGIAGEYSPEELVGRQIAVIVNLRPATIRGVQSFGMLLAADVEGKAILLQPDKPVPAGSPIK